jgi:hypothetical protein
LKIIIVKKEIINDDIIKLKDKKKHGSASPLLKGGRGSMTRLKIIPSNTIQKGSLSPLKRDNLIKIRTIKYINNYKQCPHCHELIHTDKLILHQTFCLQNPKNHISICQYCHRNMRGLQDNLENHLKRCQMVQKKCVVCCKFFNIKKFKNHF